MRLIDADALCEDLLKRWDTADTKKEELIKTVMADIVTPIIACQPTIEPERKTGKWIRHPEWQADGECGYECDQCGMGSDVDYDFCMRCGADMRGEQT